LIANDQFAAEALKVSTILSGICFFQCQDGVLCRHHRFNSRANERAVHFQEMRKMIAPKGTTMPSRQTFWVLGAGRFGRRAVNLLSRAAPGSKMVVIDRQPVRDLPDGLEVIQADGVQWFTEHFSPAAEVDKIVPALPVHLAADWLALKLAGEQGTVSAVEIPDELLRHLPHPVRLSPHRLVTSHADFLCPTNCSEPDDFCTHTKMVRPVPLYDLLAAVVHDNFVPLILKSRQFAPGVGGFLPKDLWILLDRARSFSSAPLLVGSACKCHGIVDGLITVHRHPVSSGHSSSHSQL
jgi:hypothetical protein